MPILAPPQGETNKRLSIIPLCVVTSHLNLSVSLPVCLTACLSHCLSVSQSLHRQQSHRQTDSHPRPDLLLQVSDSDELKEPEL